MPQLTLYSFPPSRQAQNGKSLSNSARARSIASRSGTEFSQSVWSGAKTFRPPAHRTFRETSRADPVALTSGAIVSIRSRRLARHLALLGMGDLEWSSSRYRLSTAELFRQCVVIGRVTQRSVQPAVPVPDESGGRRSARLGDGSRRRLRGGPRTVRGYAHGQQANRKIQRISFSIGGS